jgi:hypothetical protein
VRLLFVSCACFMFRAILNRDDDRVLEGHAAASRGGEKSAEPHRIGPCLAPVAVILVFTGISSLSSMHLKLACMTLTT